MAGTFTLRNLNGQLPATKTTLYTVPALTQTVVKVITVVNTNINKITFNLYINTGTSRRITSEDRNLEPSETANDTNVYLLAAGALIEGDASIASVADYTISIVEET